MSLPKVTHELHRRRRGRNMGLGLVLAAFIVIIFGMTVVKIATGGFDEAPAEEQVTE
ncbi:hypothetical protein [Pontibaca methylaminivorans]|uniref:hypothetical protein n=1 Tax=Pontibaca methylaminivorans TaxID=515897 RepID=UPI002FD9F19B